MTGSEINEYLDSLPRKGFAELTMADETLWLVLSDADVSLTADGAVVLEGRVGYGPLSVSRGSVLLDPDQVGYVRHWPEAAS